MIKPVKALYDYLQDNQEYSNKVSIHLRKYNEVLSTRGGQSPNNQAQKELNIGCTKPFYQLIIRPDGKVSLCCNDAYGKYTMGDASTERLEDIWQGDKYHDLRQKFLQGGRQAVQGICRYCDTITY